MSQQELGKKIKQIRQRKKMTQQELGELAGITKSHVSKIENGAATPALPTLSKIAKVLGTPASWFISQEAHGELSIVRHEERKNDPRGSDIGYSYELLANKQSVSLISPTIVTVLPEAETTAPYTHEEDEFIFIVSGSIRLQFGDRQYPLSVGDSAYFSGRHPHIFLPAGEEKASVLTINIESQV